MAYLNLDLDYFDHPKTKRLVGLLGRGADLLPIRLWTYCGKFHEEDGKLTGYSEQEIESLAGWWGKRGAMMAAMRTSRLMHQDGGEWCMTGWKEHQGHIAALKAKGRAMANKRWGRIHTASNAGSIAEKRPQQCSVPTVPTVPTVPCEKSRAREECAERIRVLTEEICLAYGRTSKRLTYAEESTLAELCRSPRVVDEWVELQAYKARLPQDRKKFFPNAIESLLLNWHKTLDTSRNRSEDAPKPKDGPKLHEVTAYAKEKWGDNANYLNWATSFYRYWNERNWRRKGVFIDWKIELGNNVSKWRADEQQL